MGHFIRKLIPFSIFATGLPGKSAARGKPLTPRKEKLRLFKKPKQIPTKKALRFKTQGKIS